MKTLLAALVCVCVALPGAAAGAFASAAEALLRRMDDAMAMQSYDGVFTYMRGDTVSSLRIMHTVINGVHYERLIHLDGTPREIVRVGNNVVFLMLRGDELAELADDLPLGPMTRAFVRNYRHVPGQYRIALRGTDRIAGRVAQLVTIEPIDADRYGHQLWLDEATGMLLKSQLVRDDGTPLEVFQFAQISLGRPISPREFQAQVDSGRVMRKLTLPPARPVAARARQAASGWRVGWLPRGFTMASQTIRRGAQGAPALQTQFYGDGLAALSVFIEPLPQRAGASDAAPIMREGATIAFSVVARDRENRSHLVTVVGEVPPATAERVARSVLARPGRGARRPPRPPIPW